MIWIIGGYCIRFAGIDIGGKTVMGISRDGLVCLRGWVLVRPLVSGENGLVSVGGVEIEIVGDYRLHRVANVIGEVIAVCGSGNVSRSMIEEGDVRLGVGDLVWYSWNAVRDSGEDGRKVIVDGVGECLWLEYERCFCYVGSDSLSLFRRSCSSVSLPRDDRFRYVRGLNGFCLGVGIEVGVDSSSTGLYLGDRRRSNRKVRIVSVSEPLVRYCVPEYSRSGSLVDEEFYPRDSMSEVSVGDVVLLEKGCDIPIEGDFSRMLVGDGGVIPFRFQRKDIICVVEGDIDGGDGDVVESDVRLAADNISDDRGVDIVEWEKIQHDTAKIARGGKKSFQY